MKFKGTKGEWKINESNEMSIIDNSGDYFDELICQTNGKSGNERKANAKLIAAAPDLLEALTFIESYINKMGVVSIAMGNIKRKAKEAIKKATE